MTEWFSRTELLLGRSAMERLASCRVLVFGLGGVGGYCVEALARSGMGALDLVDHDTVSLTNLNRQILALHGTLGRSKAEVAAERVAQINPDCAVTARKTFFLPGMEGEFDFSKYDYVADCVDTVAAKIAIVEAAQRAGVPVISCMGTGNKTDPTMLEVAWLADTAVCPLARVMRRELKKRGADRLKVVYSKEPPIRPMREESEEAEAGARRQIPGSTAFVPAAAGLILAAEIVRDLCGCPRTTQEK